MRSRLTLSGDGESPVSGDANRRRGQGFRIGGAGLGGVHGRAADTSRSPTPARGRDDRNGLSDPYIIVALNGGGEQKTKIVKKTLDPVYDHTFVFDADSLTGDDDTVTLTMYDYDFGQADDFMGEIVLRASPPAALVAEKWYKLAHRANETTKQQKEEVRGRVLVRMAFLSGCAKTIAAHLGAGDSAPSSPRAGEADAPPHEKNLRKLDERGEKLKGVGDKSQQLQDDAMEMGSLAGSLKRSLEEKKKGVFGGAFKH